MSDLTANTAPATDALPSSAPTASATSSSAPAQVSAPAPASSSAAAAASLPEPTAAELQAQIAQLTSLVTKALQPAAVSSSSAPATVTVSHLSEAEVPKVGAPVVYKGRHGIVLDVLASTRSNGTSTWSQFSVLVGLFRESHVVDAEEVTEI